jgi:hypothetical protein
MIERPRAEFRQCRALDLESAGRRDAPQNRADWRRAAVDGSTPDRRAKACSAAGSMGGLNSAARACGERISCFFLAGFPGAHNPSFAQQSGLSLFFNALVSAQPIMGRPKTAFRAGEFREPFDPGLVDLPEAARWREWMGRVEAVIFAARSPVPRDALARVVGSACMP